MAHSDRIARDTLYRSCGLPSRFIKLLTITDEDVGKIFVVNPDEKSGRLMTRKEFNKLTCEELGQWRDIDEFDVRPA